MWLLLGVLFNFFQATTLYVDGNAVDQNNDCTVKIIPCSTLSATVISAHEHNDSINTILLEGSITDSAETIEFSKETNIIGDSEASYCLDESGHVHGKESQIIINNTVLMSAFTFYVSNSTKDLLSIPLIRVSSSGILNIVSVLFTNITSESIRYAPLIDSTEGKLVLECVTFQNLQLYNTSLLNISDKSGAFTMKSLLTLDACGSEAYSDCLFQSITRFGGNGTIFSLYLSQTSDVCLSNATFSNCINIGSGYHDGFGGCIYLYTLSDSTTITFSNLTFDSCQAQSVYSLQYGQCVFADLPSKPSFDVWKPLLVANQIVGYHNNTFVVSTSQAMQQTELVNAFDLPPAHYIGPNISLTPTGAFHDPYPSFDTANANSPSIIYVLGSPETAYRTSVQFTVPNVEIRSSYLTHGDDSPIAVTLTQLDTALFTVTQTSALSILYLSFSAAFSSSENMNTFFLVYGSLSISHCSFDYASPSDKLIIYLINSTSGTLSLSSVTFSNFATSSSSLLKVSPLTGAFSMSSVVFSGISRESGNGCVFEETVPTGYALSLKGATFDSCSSLDGCGGAAALTITGGSVEIAASGAECGGSVDTPMFSGCTATAGDSGLGNGGALWVSLSAGTVTLGTSAVDANGDSISTSFVNCYAYDSSSQLSDGAGVGGAIYLNVTATPTAVTFEHLSFSSASAAYAGHGTYVYMTVTSTTWVNTTWEETFRPLVFFLVTASDNEFLLNYGSQLFQIYELDCYNAALMISADAPNQTKDCGTNITTDPCYTLQCALGSLQYLLASTQTKIFVESYPTNQEFTSLTFSKSFVNISSLSASAATQPSIPFNATTATTALITVSATTSATLVVHNLRFSLISAVATAADRSDVMSASLFAVSSSASLILEGVVMSSTAAVVLSVPLVDSSDGHLNLSSATTFTSFTCNQTALLKFALSADSFITNDCVFTNITRISGNGSVIEATLPSGSSLALSWATFNTCVCEQGNGGAVSLNITGGSATFGTAVNTSEQLLFVECTAAEANSSKATTEPGAHGGALHIIISAGTLQIGSTGTAYDDITPVTFSRCGLSKEKNAEGGAIYLRMTAESDITFGDIDFTNVVTVTDAWGLFVYFTTPVFDYILTLGRWSQLLSDSANITSPDCYVAYDEAQHRTYNMHRIGPSSIIVSDSGSDTLFCGHPYTPCATVAGAVVSQSHFVLTPAYITITDTLDRSSVEPVRFHTSVVVNSSSSDRNATIVYVRSATDATQAVFTSYTSTSFVNLAFVRTHPLPVPIFAAVDSGMLEFLNVIVSSDTRYASECSLVDSTDGILRLRDSELTHILTLNVPLLRPSSSSGAFVLYSTNNFTRIVRGTTYTLDVSDYSMEYIDNSLASIDGGAVLDQKLTEASDRFEIVGATFRQCNSTGNGGAVRITMTNGTLIIGDVVSTGSNRRKTVFMRCAAKCLTCSHHDNADDIDTLHAGGYGGAIHINVQQRSSSDMEFDFHSVTFTDNFASASGSSLIVTTNNRRILKDNAWNYLIPTLQESDEDQYMFAVVDTAGHLSVQDMHALVKGGASDEESGLSAGLIAAIVLAVLVFVIIVVIVIIIICCICCVHHDSSSSSSSSRSTRIPPDSVRQPPEDSYSEHDDSDSDSAERSTTTARTGGTAASTWTPHRATQEPPPPPSTTRRNATASSPPPEDPTASQPPPEDDDGPPPSPPAGDADAPPRDSPPPDSETPPP